MALEVFICAILGPVCGSALVTFLDDFDGFDGLFSVAELLKVFASFRVVDGFCPFAEEAANELLHLSLHICTDAEFVLQDDFL